MTVKIEMYESVDVVPAFADDGRVVYVVNGINSSRAVDDIVVLLAAVQILEELPGTGDWSRLLRQFVESIEVEDVDEPIEG